MRKLKLFLSVLMLMAFSVGTVWGTEVTFNYLDYKGKGANSTGSEYTMSDKADVSIGDTKFYGNNSYAHFYANGVSTITPASGVTITQVVLTASSTSYNGYQSSGTVTASTGTVTGSTSSTTVTWTGSATSAFTISHNKQIRWTSIVVTYSKSASSYTITAATNNESYGTVALSGTVITATPKSGCAIDDETPYTVTSGSATVVRGTGENINKFTVTPTSDCTVRINFKELPKHTVTWNNNGVTSTTQVAEGEKPIFPATPASCDGTSTTFYGWAAAPWTGKLADLSGKTVYTNASAMPDVAAAVTYYAVFAKVEESGAAVDATLWGEDFSGFKGDDVPESGNAKTVVYSGSVTYACTNGTGGGTTKIYDSGTMSAGGESPELLVAKSNGTFAISGIPVAGAKTATLTYHTNQSSNLTVTTSTEKVTVGNVSVDAVDTKLCTRTITFADGVASTFDLTFTMTTSSNSRLDDVVLKVATNNSTASDFITTCCESHTITVDDAVAFGSIEADLASACEGATITLTATPNEHCRFVEWDVKQGETPVSVSDSKFTMPDGDVTVSAVFAEIKNAVKVSDPEHGTINVTGAANLDEVLEGTELEVSVTGSGYKFTLDAYKYGETGTKVTITDGKLTMPAYDIVITANEEKLVSPTILVDKNVIDFGKAVKAAAAPAAETFTINGSNLTGDLSLAWETDDAYFAWEVTEGSLAANAGVVTATISVSVTAKGMSTAGNLVDNLVVSGGGAESKEVTVGIEVQETYTAKWYLNGEELTESTQTAIEGTNLNVPADPTKLADDCAGMVFKGWAAAEIEGKKADAPEFVTTEDLKMGNANVNYYAVFATQENTGSLEEESVSTTMSAYITANSCTVSSGNDATMYKELTLDANITLSTTGDDNCGSFWGTSPNNDWRLYQAKSGNAVLTAANGYTLKSVKFTYGASNGGVLLDGETQVATASKYDISGASKTFTVGNSGSATNGQVKITAIEIEYEKDTRSTTFKDYVTTCPECTKVTLSKAVEGNGTLVLKQNGVEVSAPVMTCEAATVNVEATPATGYELDGVAVSGVEGAAYNAGVISIPAGKEGTLNVSATFTAINYTVTMEQTGGAEAEISGNQENKHYGNEITVTAGEKAGYYFLGWAADVEVDFANAKALTTTFPMPASNVKVTAKYAKILSVAEALALIPNEDDKKDDQVVEGYIKSVESYSSTYKSITYTLMDLDANGFAKTTTIKVYGGKGIESADFSAKDDLEVGAKARIFGQLLYHSTGGQEINSNNYQLSYDAPEFDAVVIYGEASKTAYEKGAAFEFDGLSAKNTYKNGYATAIESPVWAADPATINAAGTVNVTAKNADEKISAVKEVTVTVKTHKVIFKDYDEDYHVYLSVKNGLENVNSGDEFVKGTVLTVEPTLYYTAEDVLKTLTANEVDIKTTKTFIIGEENVTISATTESKPLAPISWLPASASIALNGDVATLPTLSNEKGLEIRYTCDKDAVATIDENTGEITLVGVGEATITAQSVATPEGAYMTTFAQLILTVTDATYAVNFAAPANGTLVVFDKGTGDPVADGAKFVKDDELVINAYAASGYKLETLTVNGDNFTNGDTYKVGTKDIVIVATFVKDSGTAIDNTEAGVKAVKMIENGVLIIRRGDKSFNAQGQLIR